MSSPADQQADRIRLGLIQYLSTRTVDPDYAWVAARTPGLGGRRSRLAGVVTVLVFGVMVATAASQTTRNAGTAEREHQDLVRQIEARRSVVTQRLDQRARLTAEDRRLQDRLLINDTTASSLASRARRLSPLTGTVAVRGPGVRFVVDDAAGADSERERVLDRDLQGLVNGLWAAGADAVSINGQRITPLTAIRYAGAINVNYVPLRAPYTVSAIGDPDTLTSRFADTTSGAAWFDLVQQVGLRQTIRNVPTMRLPAADATLRYATTPEGGIS